MAKTITLYEAGARLAELVDEIAESGEPITVTQHGHPVVVLVRPDQIGGHPPADDARYAAGDHRSEPEMLLDTLRAGRA